MPTLTRRELYDLVWSTPMTKLAENFGISDVGLAKICDRHRIPTPPRGYWAKKEAGNKVKQAIFARINDPLLDRIEIAASQDKLPEPVREIVAQRRAERKAAAKPVKASVMAPPVFDPVEQPHPAISAIVKALRYGKPSSSGIIEAIGPGLGGLSISAQTVERLILILDRLARACEERGIVLVPSNTRIAVTMGADAITFEIKEKTKQVPHVLTEAEIAVEEKRRKRDERWARGQYNRHLDNFFAPLPPKFDTVRTGELGLEVHNWGDGLRRSWRDGKMQVLETLIGEIVDGFEAHITVSRLRREAQERAEAERRELERRRSLAKARRERESDRKALLKRLMRAERQASQMRDWLARQDSVPQEDADLVRMLAWVHGQLAELEAILDPKKLADDIRNRKLFPEIDALHDPLGDPPPERRWW